VDFRYKSEAGPGHGKTTKDENHTNLKMREKRNEYENQGIFFYRGDPQKKRMNDGNGKAWGATSGARAR
jgi:hypothetical protein